MWITVKVIWLTYCVSAAGLKNSLTVRIEGWTSWWIICLLPTALFRRYQPETEACVWPPHVLIESIHLTFIPRLDVEGVDSSTPPPTDRHRTLEKSPEDPNRSASNSPRTAKAKTLTVRWVCLHVRVCACVHVCVTLVLVETVLPTSLLAGHPGLQLCWYTYLNILCTTGILNNTFTFMCDLLAVSSDGMKCVTLPWFHVSNPQTWQLCLCHRKPLWNSRVVTPTDDVHLCIMCLRAIMNYQVSQNAHTHSPELAWQRQCFMNTTPAWQKK